MAIDEYPINRPFQRNRVQLPMLLTIPGQVSEYRSMTVDLSSRGVRLQFVPALQRGQVVRLHLAAAPEKFVPARVAWVGKADSPQAGEAGFQFLIPWEFDSKSV